MPRNLKSGVVDGLRGLALSLCLAAFVPCVIAQNGPQQGADVSAEIVAGDTLRVTWSLADGYWIFKDKLALRTTTEGVTLGALKVPPGQLVSDDFFGDVEVFAGEVTVDAPILLGGQAPSTLALEATSQGCSDNGECGPATTASISVDWASERQAPEPAASSAAPAISAAPEPELNPVEALSKLGANLLGAGSGEPEFLDPDEAFVLSTEVREDGTLVARWVIADEYYLYRSKFDFAPKDAALRFGAPQFTQGKVKEDDYFGTVEVYYHNAEATLPIERNDSGARQVEMDVRYQGCADAGLCYPPITKTVALVLPASAEQTPPAAGFSAAPAADTPVADLPEQDRIAHSLATGSLIFVLPLFFGFGLLLTFTPCVFPMVPILSGIIVGEGERLTTGRAFRLSLVYVLAMALTYTAAGVVAGLFGANLQALFQDPRVLVAFSAVFVLLSLSMFGFYDLQIPAGLQTRLNAMSSRQAGGTYIGAGIMGFLSALIIGPCVAAPLAGALIYIGQTGDAVLGGLALFALSLGMGAPLLLIGTSAGRLLPKAGAWMNTVKAVFGVALLAVAIYLLERIVPEWVSLLLWAALFIVSAIYMGALDSLTQETTGWRRFSKGSGLVLLVYGVLLMVGAAGGGHGDLLQPLRGLAGGAREAGQELEFKPVKGTQGLRAELLAAASEGKPVMLDYYADWCVSCKEMEKLTFTDPGVQSVLAQAVLLQTDVTANDELDKALLKEFDLFGPPAILFFGADGRELPQYRVVGFMKAAEFRAVVEKATRPRELRSTQLASPGAPDG